MAIERIASRGRLMKHLLQQSSRSHFEILNFSFVSFQESEVKWQDFEGAPGRSRRAVLRLKCDAVRQRLSYYWLASTQMNCRSVVIAPRHVFRENLEVGSRGLEI